MTFNFKFDESVVGFALLDIVFVWSVDSAKVRSDVGNVLGFGGELGKFFRRASRDARRGN
jgi:hypothetical protein